MSPPCFSTSPRITTFLTFLKLNKKWPRESPHSKNTPKRTAHTPHENDTKETKTHCSGCLFALVSLITHTCTDERRIAGKILATRPAETYKTVSRFQFPTTSLALKLPPLYLTSSLFHTRSNALEPVSDTALKLAQGNSRRMTFL